MEIFGVVNASPDSLAEFSVATGRAAAYRRSEALLGAGATHIDIGAEGSSEFATEQTPEQEWSRLAEPLTGALEAAAEQAASSTQAQVAVDTRHVEVARKALTAGASVLNAGDALQSQPMLELAADFDGQIVLPFILGADFRSLSSYRSSDPVGVMVDWFEAQLHRLKPWGVTDRLLLDPGVGFGPPNWDWSSRYEYQKAVNAGLPRLRERFKLPLYVPVAWKQTPDRLELMDLALSCRPEFVRSHRPSQVVARTAALEAGAPLPTDQLTAAHV